MRLLVGVRRGLGTGWGAVFLAGCLHAPGGEQQAPPARVAHSEEPAPVVTGSGSNYCVQTTQPKIPAETSLQAVAADAGHLIVEPPARPAARAPSVVAQAPVPAPKPPPDPPLVEALRCVLEKKSAQEALVALDPPVRDLVLALLTLATRVHENSVSRTTPQDAEAWLAQLRHLSAALRGRAPLVLSKLCLCSVIDGFGMYTSLPSDHGYQGGEHGYVYVEVRNFISQCVSDTRGASYSINLASTLEVLDFQRVPVHHETFDVVDASLTPRQDFFINFPFRIPPRMPPGSYTLRVTVRDGNHPPGGVEREAHQTFDFRVVASSH